MNSTGQILLLKVTLAPLLVALVSLAAMRLGARIAGIIAAFPMVSGPVLYLFAVEQGRQFTSEAAHQTLFGTLSLVGYCLVYAIAANRFRSRWSPWLSLLFGWVAFLCLTLLLKNIAFPRWLGLPVALLSVVVGLKLLPHPSEVAREPLRNIRNDGKARATRLLLYRMLSAAVLVYALSEAARAIGPVYSGLLTPFPVASTVLVVTTHLEQGREGLFGWLRGFMVGLFGYLAFIATVAWLIVPGGIAVTFTVGLLGALLVQSVAQRPRFRRNALPPILPRR